MENILIVASIIKKCKELLGNEEIVTNLKTKVSIQKIEVYFDEEDAKWGQVGLARTEYKVVDQTSIIRPKRATLVVYNDGEPYCEYSWFKNEQDILDSVSKT